jgi:hypothetical protein
MELSKTWVPVRPR